MYDGVYVMYVMYNLVYYINQQFFLFRMDQSTGLLISFK